MHIHRFAGAHKVLDVFDHVPLQEAVHHVIVERIRTILEQPFPCYVRQLVATILKPQVARPDKTVEQLLGGPRLGSDLLGHFAGRYVPVLERLKEAELGGNHDRPREQHGLQRIEQGRG